MAYVTKSKELILATLIQGETLTPVFASATFNGTYKIACFEQGIANPNLTSRQARLLMNRTGLAEIWDQDRFPYAEAARWEVGGKIIRFQKIPVKIQ